MGITVTVARFSTPTSIGNQTWTDTNLGGLTPKAIMVIANHADTDGTAEDELVFGIGFADSTREASTTGHSDHGAATSNTDIKNTGTFVGDIIVGGPTSQVTAGFVSFQSNSVTLDFTAVDTDAQLWTVVFFAGTDLSVYAGFEENVSTGGTNITAIGFEPDLVLAATSYQGVASSAVHIVSAFGACVNDGTEKTRSWGLGSRDGQSTTVTSTQLDTVGLAPVWNDSQNYDLQFSDFDADGFTITADNGNRFFAYLALNFGGAATAKVNSIDSPTSTGNDARTGLGITPQVVLLGLTDCQAEDTVEGDADAGSVGISVFTADAEYCNSWADEDAQTTTDTQSLADNQAVNFASGDGSTQHAATFVSLDSAGYTLNYSAADGTARKWFEVVIGTASAQQPLYVEITAAGEERFPAAAAFAAEAASLDAAGVEQPAGTADLISSTPTLDATGELPVDGTGNFLAGTTELDAAGIEHPRGAAALDVQLAVLAAQGLQEFIGVALFGLAAADFDASGVMVPAGQADLGIADLLLDASGANLGDVTGIGEFILSADTAVLYDGELVEYDGQQVTFGVEPSFELNATATTGEPEGTATPTLQLLELDAAGLLVPAGAGDLRLGASELVAQGLQEFIGAADFSIDRPTLDATGLLVPAGIGSFAVNPIEFDANGVLVPEGAGDLLLQIAELVAVGTMNVGAQEPLYVELVAAGEEQFPGTAAFAAEALSLAVQGVEQPEGTANLISSPPTLDAAGELPVDSAGDFLASAVALDANAIEHPRGAADLVLQDTDLTAVGAAGEPEGAANLTLQLFELDAAGVLVPAGAGALDFAAVDLAAAGVQIVVGASDLVLQLLELDTAGEHIAGAQPEGAANLVLTPIDLDAVGLEHPRGTGVFDLAAALLSATGEERLPGAAVFELGLVDLAALGRQIQTGAADLQLELAELVATGAIQPAGTADLTLQLLQLAATGHQVPAAVADLQLQVNELAAVAELPFEAAAQLLIASLRLTAAGEITAPFTPGLVAAVCSQAGISTTIGGAGVASTLGAGTATSDIGPDE